MTGDRKKIAVLSGLFLVWAGLALWQWSALPEPVRVPLVNVSGRVTAQAASGGRAEPLHVQLGLLSSSRTQRDMPFAAPRNIFAPPTSEAAAASGAEPAADLSQQQQAILAELAQFHYLGFVRNEEPDKKRDMAVLTRDDDLHLVRKGEMIDNRVLVKAITQDSVTLQDRDSRMEYTVLLSEESPVQP